MGLQRCTRTTSAVPEGAGSELGSKLARCRRDGVAHWCGGVRHRLQRFLQRRKAWNVVEASRPTHALSPQPYHHLFLSHCRHEGVFIVRGKEDSLVTRNFVPGKTVYNEKLVKVDVSAFHLHPGLPLLQPAASLLAPARSSQTARACMSVVVWWGGVYSSTCPPVFADVLSVLFTSLLVAG